MESTRVFKLNNSGQALVEYVLIIGVIMAIFVNILKSDQFKGVFGPEAEFFKRLRAKMAYEYRHGVSGEVDQTVESGIIHESYFKGGKTRFFIPEQPYEK